MVAEATPLITTKCTWAMATFSFCSNVATRLLTGMIIKEQTSPLASLEARWLRSKYQRLLSRPLKMRGAFAPIIQQ